VTAPPRFSKAADSDQLLQLSRDVGRIAQTLARLSSDQDQEQPVHPFASQTAEVSPETVRTLIRVRRRRARYLPDDLLADPVWDMLLDLLDSEIEQRRVSVSSVCAASGVPATTALRWLRTMEKKGLVLRRPDLLDGRRVYVELSPATSEALRRYFAENVRRIDSQ